MWKSSGQENRRQSRVLSSQKLVEPFRDSLPKFTVQDMSISMFRGPCFPYLSLVDISDISCFFFARGRGKERRRGSGHGSRFYLKTKGEDLRRRRGWGGGARLDVCGGVLHLFSRPKLPLSQGNLNRRVSQTECLFILDFSGHPEFSGAVLPKRRQVQERPFKNTPFNLFSNTSTKVLSSFS